jgi:tetratricopeptide (TPR) repeat protein
MLESHLKPVFSKRRSVVVGLWGEAGVGKSYTVQSLLRDLPCQSLSLHATLPTQQLLQRLPRARKLAPWAQQTLERALARDFVEGSSLTDALAANLSALAPFVLHLEDIHELDTDRLEFVKSFAQTLQRSKGVGLLVTSRVEPPEPFTALRRMGLTRVASDALIENEIKTSLPKEALEFIYSKASGNPLYTLEYLRFLTRQGNLWNDGKIWNWRKPEGKFVPATVEALIELTLAKVSRDNTLKTLVQAKSYVPLEGHDLLGAVAELSPLELQEASQSLRRQGVFVNDTFTHPLYRELSLQHLPETKREEFARRALHFLGAEPVKAAEFLPDANLPNDQVLSLLHEAIASSKKTNQDLQTGKLLSRLLEYLPRDQQAEVALEAATLLKSIAVNESSRLAALAAKLSATLAPTAVLLQAELLAVQGHLAEAETLWQTLEATQANNAYLTGMVQIRGVAHDYAGVVKIFERCPECFANPDAATTHFIVRGLAQHGQLELAKQMIAQAKVSSDEDRVLFLKAQSDVAYTLSDFAAMEALEAEIYVRAKALGNLRVMDQALFNRALALESLGRYEERKTCLEEAMRVCEELGDVTALMIAQRAYGGLLADLGEVERAESYLQGARQYLESIAFYLYQQDCEMTLSHFYRESSGSYANVLSLKHARAALECSKRIGHPSSVADALCTLALAHMDNAQLAEAEKSLVQAEETLRGTQLQQSQLALQSAKAYLCKAKGDHEQARQFFAEAVKNAADHGARLEQERLGLELDRLSNDVLSAKKRLQWFEERGLLSGVKFANKLFPEFDLQHPVTEKPEQPSGTRLEVLGPMQLFVGGVREAVRGSKRQEFLALLLERKLFGRAEVSRLELLDILYSGDDELKASSNLRELVHILRDRLGSSVILTTASGYALGDMASDAEQFLQTSDSSLWRGVYLEGMEPEDSVAEPLYLLLFSKAQELLESDPKEAVRVARLLLESDPYNHDYLKLCLQALRATNNHKSLTRLYSEAKGRFVELGEALPAQWLDYLG